MKGYFEFLQLELDEQIEFITEHGSYLAWKSNGEYNVYLYRVEDFFAEAWMNVKMSKIMRIECSNGKNIPGGYDSSIQIN